MEKIFNYVNGELVAPAQGRYLENFNPATGEVYSKIPDSDQEDFNLAIKAAEQAFPDWRDLSVGQRSDYLMKISEAISAKLPELAKAESNDTGKPLWLAESVDIPRSAENFKFFAQAITQFSSECFHGMNGLNYTLRQPIGVVGCISPWNLPLYLFSWKIAPALAAGNCVIAKPSELSPYTAYLLSKICIEVGLPKGVLNILHGTGQNIGEPIVTSKTVKAVSFTGGTSTGKRIAELSAPLLRKLSLELGGKNPAIVFADSDLDKTVSELVRSSFTNQGEICLCCSRIYIQKEIYDQFKQQFVAKVKALKLGDPAEEDTDIGALISAAHLAKVKSYVKLAIDEGGILLCGTENIDVKLKGYFLRPHVFEGLNNSCRLNQEEVFGPVVSIQPFSDMSEALELANDSAYGLASSVWTKNLETAHYMSEKLQTGIVWINTWMKRDLRTPFGGMKNSGLGREGGQEALRFFTEPKNISF